MIRLTAICATAACALGVALIAGGCTSEAGTPGDARGGATLATPAPDTVALLFWNVENFFDLVNDGGEYPEFKPGSHGWDQFTYEVKLNNIASAIAAANADIVALCEVENRNAAEAIRSELARRGRVYPAVAYGDQPVATNTMPVLLSRLPVSGVRGSATVKGEAGYDSRNILEADILYGDDTLTIFVNHWPSKRQAESYRVVAAESLAAAIARLPPHRDYVVLGDFNADYNESDVLAAGGFDDTRGKTGVNHVLRTVSTAPNRFADFIDQIELDTAMPGSHYDLWLELDESARGSYRHRGRWTTPDHILVPRALLDTRGVSYVDNSFAPFTHSDSLIRNGSPYGWQTKYRKSGKYHVGAGYSDHLPLQMRLRRGAFDAANPRHIPPPDTSRTLSFEKNTQGWLAGDAGLSVRRECGVSSEGACALLIAGTMGKRNATTARAVLPAWLMPAGRLQALSFDIRGHGPISIRVRAVGAQKWRYFNAPDFAPLKSARFKPWSAEKWTKLSLDVAGIARAREGLEIEVRAAKLSQVEWRLDRMSLR